MGRAVAPFKRARLIEEQAEDPPPKRMREEPPPDSGTNIDNTSPRKVVSWEWPRSGHTCRFAELSKISAKH